MRSLFQIIYIHCSSRILLCMMQAFQTTHCADNAGKLSEGLSTSGSEDTTTSTNTRFVNDAVGSPCAVTLDTTYLGALINCSNKGISNINPAWFPGNATTLLLDNNAIIRLPNGSFQHLMFLRVLSIRNSGVRKIDVSTRVFFPIVPLIFHLLFHITHKTQLV